MVVLYRHRLTQSAPSLPSRSSWGITWLVSHESWPVRVLKTLAMFFGLQNCVKFVLSEVLPYIWYKNNQKSDHLFCNNSSVWYTWQHFNHDRLCTTLSWTLNRSIFPQHSSHVFYPLKLYACWVVPTWMAVHVPSAEIGHWCLQKQWDNLVVNGSHIGD